MEMTYRCFRKILTGLKKEYIDYQKAHSDVSDVPQDSDINNNLPEEEKTLLRTLAMNKGKRPEDVKGITHKLMSMAWTNNGIENILETSDEDLLYLFYSKCVSRAVGKQKWNEFKDEKCLNEFVNPSDEALAMLVIENNLTKWMDEIRFGQDQRANEKHKTLYTEGEQGCKWTKRGMLRFVELLKGCREY